MGYRSQGDGEPTDCPECNGSGNVRVILGDDEQQDRCQSCGGMGYQLTRDEFANLDALRADRDDLRLVDHAGERRQLREWDRQYENATPQEPAA
jgi:hypothetical protein